MTGPNAKSPSPGARGAPTRPQTNDPQKVDPKAGGLNAGDPNARDPDSLDPLEARRARGLRTRAGATPRREADALTPRLLLLVLAAALPLIMLPILGSTMVDAMQRAASPDLTEPGPEGPVRLVTQPLMTAIDLHRNAMVAVIDLPSRAAATALCRRAPHLNDALQIFAARNPNRVDPQSRVPGWDPALARTLRDRFPDFPIDGVRLSAPTAYADFYPRREVYECRGLSETRIAKPVTDPLLR